MLRTPCRGGPGGTLTFLRLRASSRAPPLSSPSPAPSSRGCLGLSSSSVRTSSVLSPRSAPVRSFLVNSAAARKRGLVRVAAWAGGTWNKERARATCCWRCQARQGQRGGGQSTVPLTWVQVCHAVLTVARGHAVPVAGLGLPEGWSPAGWPVTVHLVFPPPPLVQEAGGHVLHALLLALLICRWRQTRLSPRLRPPGPAPHPTGTEQRRQRDAKPARSYRDRWGQRGVADGHSTDLPGCRGPGHLTRKHAGLSPGGQHSGSWNWRPLC